MVKSSSVVLAAKSYIGTPIVHQARIRGVGIDCVGLVICSLRDAGVTVEDYTDYRITDRKKLCRVLDEQLVEVEEMSPGCILAFCKNPRHPIPGHLGIATEKGMIHANIRIRKIAEHSLGSPYGERIVGIYQHPEVCYG